MSKDEQREVHSSLKIRGNEITKEMAATEVNFKAAGVLFASLSRLLAECQVASLDWGRYQKLTAGLPDMARRYEALKSELASVERQLDKFVGMD